jgi:hypothetical protein
MSDTVTAPTGAPAPTGTTSGLAPGTPSTGATKQGETPAQAEARMLKRRMGDKEIELPESKVWANYDKGENAAQLLSKVEQRRQEALRAKMEADGILGRLKDKGNLRSVLQELGYTAEDLRAMSEREILSAIELEKMTPAERRAHEAEQKLKGYEDEKKKAAEEQQQAQFQEEVKKHADEFATLFVGTMEALGLPKASGRHVLPRMARLYEQNEAAGLESSPEEMASYVLEGLKKEHAGVLSGLEGDALLEHLGPDTVKKVLAAHLGKVRTRQGRPAAPVAAAPVSEPRVPAGGLHARKGRWAVIDEQFGK